MSRRPSALVRWLRFLALVWTTPREPAPERRRLRAHASKHHTLTHWKG